MRLTQLSLFDKDTKRIYSRTKHGGADSVGKRKLERPLSSKHWTHLVLKSDKAQGKLNLLLPRNQIFIEQTLREKARKFGVRIADKVIMRDHVHMKLRASSRDNFQRFLKSVTALIARFVTGARRGKPFGRFWKHLAFTRVLKSYREELHLTGYFDANRVECEAGYQRRERYRAFFNDWVRARVPGSGQKRHKLAP